MGGDEEERLAVRAALAQLSPLVRAVVVLHHMVGLSVREVADVVGTSENTVKTQLRTGLARLREVLGDDYGSAGAGRLAGSRSGSDVS